MLYIIVSSPTTALFPSVNPSDLCLGTALTSLYLHSNAAKATIFKSRYYSLLLQITDLRTKPLEAYQMASSIPDLTFTAIDDVVSVVQRVRQTFHTHKTRPLDFRLVQLRKLYWAYVTHSEPGQSYSILIPRYQHQGP